MTAPGGVDGGNGDVMVSTSDGGRPAVVAEKLPRSRAGQLSCEVGEPTGMAAALNERNVGSWHDCAAAAVAAAEEEEEPPGGCRHTPRPEPCVCGWGRRRIAGLPSVWVLKRGRGWVRHSHVSHPKWERHKAH